LVIQPGSAQAQCFKGFVLMKTGKTDEARAVFETLDQRTDRLEWNTAHLAQTLVATNRRPEAEALLQRSTIGNFYRGLLLCALGRGDEALPLMKPGISIQRDMILWLFQDIMPRQLPEFPRKLAEWGMTDSWERAEAWRAKNLPRKSQTAMQP